MKAWSNKQHCKTGLPPVNTQPEWAWRWEDPGESWEPTGNKSRKALKTHLPQKCIQDPAVLSFQHPHKVVGTTESTAGKCENQQIGTKSFLGVGKGMS